jgi:putative ABC transport system permease protein
VKSRFLLFTRLILRPLFSEPVRTLLTLVAVTLGVSVVVAIDLAAQAAAGSFHSSVESLTGPGDLLITGTTGIDERLLGKLVQLPYPLEFMPRLEGFASIDGKGEALPFIGLDLIGLADARGTPSIGENPLWAGPRLGLHAGEPLHLLINDSMRTFTVAGVLPSRAGQAAENRVLVADIGLAQAVMGKTGRLDSISVKVPAASSIEHWLSLLAHQLPVGVSVAPAGARTEENRKMLAAFRANLRMLSYIALVVGAFLIYNNIAISVVRRRNEIGVLRSLGATRAMILCGFLSEAAFFGICGGVLGLLLGRVLALGAVRLISNTVESLYVSSEPAPIQITVAAAAAGLVLAFSASLLAALAPAFEASRIAPVEAMARGRNEFVARTHSRPRVLLAILLFGAAAVLSQVPPVHRQPLPAYAAILLLVAGTALLMPGLIRFFVGSAHRLMYSIFGIEASLAMRSLEASLARTSVLATALTTAVAMTASVAIMVASFRQTVSVWMNDQLKADFYLRPAGAPAADLHPTMSAAIAERIERLAGVAAVDRFRAYPISYQGMPATLAGGQSSRVSTASPTRFLPGEDEQAILRKLPTGDFAVISEPFANKHHLNVGDRIHLALGGALRSFQVLGIYYDYSTEQGYIVLDRNTLLRYLPDRALSNLAIYLKPGADPARVRREIDQLLNGRAVLVFANRFLREAAISTFDRTFRITYALEFVSISVAVMGVAGALLAVIIDRRREFAILRFLGAAQSQVRRIIVCEAGLLGVLANAVGLALGTLLSLVLIFVINKQSFGWTIQFHWPFALLFAVLTGVFVATLLAALYPARVALSMNPIEVVHEE